MNMGRTLIDLGASINLMSLSVAIKIGYLDLKKTRMTLQLTYKFIKHPSNINEDVLVKVDKFIYLVDFIVMDIKR